MKRTDIIMLVVRLIIGGIFIYTGWMKVSAMADTIGFFATMGLPTAVAYAVSYTELIGGIFLVLGLWAELAAAALAIVMIGAIYLTYQTGFQMFGTPLALLAGLLSVLASGSGHYAVRFRR